MRLLLCLPLLALTACSAGPGDSVEGQPTAADERGHSVTVLSVRPGGDRTTVEILAVNGSDRPLTLGRQYSPISLQDGAGAKMDGPQQALEVPAYSSDRLRVEFAGRPEGSSMSLQAGTLTVPNLPTRSTTFTAGSSPTVGDLARVQANHPNGSTFRVTSVAFGEAETSVGVEVVNGHRNEIRLSGRQSDPAHLQDETGRVYPLVPVPNNVDLSVPQGQSMQGTLRFAGHVPGSVQRLTLRFNPRFGSDREFAPNPQVVLELPLATP